MMPGIEPGTRGASPRVTAEQNDRSNKDESTEQTNKRTNNAAPIRADNKKPYRPPLTSEYRDPAYLPDTAEGIDSIFKEFGKSLWRETHKLPPRDDVRA
eukprot:scaffold238165_cov43-Attheya_sp.AAC.1